MNDLKKSVLIAEATACLRQLCNLYPEKSRKREQVEWLLEGMGRLLPVREEEPVH